MKFFKPSASRGFNGYFIRYPESYCDKEVLHKSSAKKGNDWRQKVSVGAW